MKGLCEGPPNLGGCPTPRGDNQRRTEQAFGTPDTADPTTGGQLTTDSDGFPRSRLAPDPRRPLEYRSVFLSRERGLAKLRAGYTLDISAGLGPKILWLVRLEELAG